MANRRGSVSLARDLAWQNLEATYRSSVSYQYARYALALDYDALPKSVVHTAKRCLLDALGCAIGAFDAPGRPACEKTVDQLGGTEGSTGFGSGQRTTAFNATMANSFLVRFLDCNDIGGGGHNSDAIPSILAIAERQKANGKDFLTAIVTSYELGARFADSIGGSLASEDKGWTGEIRGGLSMPPTFGKLMGPNEGQIVNANGISACHSLPLAILDTDHEENSMTKNLRFGFVAANSILACMLAKNGFTGPVRVVEGEAGINQVLFDGKMDLDRATNFSGWRIGDTRHKTMCVNGATHGHVSATLAIVKEHALKPEDITSVKVKTCLREWRHTTALPKKYPRNAESADHSSYYANAIAIKERSLGPDSFTPDRFTDPVVLELIDKITVLGDASMGEHSNCGISYITTKDGRHFEKRIDNPHGFGNDPLTDSDLEDKFRSLAGKHMGKAQVRKLIDTVWNAERLKNVSELAKLMVVR